MIDITKLEETFNAEIARQLIDEGHKVIHPEITFYGWIISVADLAREGLDMKHCVISRERYLVDGYRTYYRVKYLGEQYTLEYGISQKRILECKGYCNVSGRELINFITKKDSPATLELTEHHPVNYYDVRAVEENLEVVECCDF